MKNLLIILIIGLPVWLNCKGREESKPPEISEQELRIVDADSLLDNYGCRACHKDYGPLIGPAYNGVRMRYQRLYPDHAADSIASYIFNGSKGKYPCSKDVSMPAFQIPAKERLIIAGYIINIGSVNSKFGKQKTE